MIDNIPTSKIRSVPMGLVEIKGNVSNPVGFPLKSPLMQKECVYFKYSVEEMARSGKDSRWEILKSRKESGPFYIKDKTGEITITLNNPIEATPNQSLTIIGKVIEYEDNFEIQAEKIISSL